MGKRLSKIYTRTGDEGTTGLGDGTRVPKTSLADLLEILAHAGSAPLGASLRREALGAP